VRPAEQLGRRGYGFEIKKDFVNAFEKELKPLGGNKEFIFQWKESENEKTD